MREITIFVAIESGYCNKAEFCGNIRAHIATVVACGSSYGCCCNKRISIATKYALVVVARFLPQIYCVAINITYCDKIYSWLYILHIATIPYCCEKKKDIATIFSKRSLFFFVYFVYFIDVFIASIIWDLHFHLFFFEQERTFPSFFFEQEPSKEHLG